MQIDMAARRELLAAVPDAKKCFQCSTCSASCMVLRYSGGYNPRILIMRALCGDTGVVSAEDLWKCSTCAQCDERCPQGVNPFEVLMKLKNLAAAKRLAPAARIAAAELIVKTGAAFPAAPAVEQRRAALGLPRPQTGADDLAKILSPEWTDEGDGR